jgi:hypothetical protein
MDKDRVSVSVFLTGVLDSHLMCCILPAPVLEIWITFKSEPNRGGVRIDGHLLV